MDKQRLQKICVIIALISLPVFLITTVFVGIVDASIENMVYDQVGDIAVFTGISITTIKDNMRSMIVNGQLPILNALFNNDQSFTDFSNAFLKQAVSEVLAQTDFFSRLCILLWAYGESVKQISLICFIISVVVWYLTGGRPSDVRNLFGNIGSSLKQLNNRIATREEKQPSSQETISISKSIPSQNGDPDSSFKKMCICAIVAAILLVGVYICNYLLPQGNGGNTDNNYPSGYHTPYIHWEPTSTPSPLPTRTPTPTLTRKPTSSIVGKTCRINDPAANVRSGPGVNYNWVGRAPQGHWYTILDCTIGDTGKDWYKINMDGTVCWLSSQLVELDGNTGGTINGEPISISVSGPFPIGEYCYAPDDGNNIRSGPGTEYSIVGVANAYEGFLIVDSKPGSTGKDWYKIQLKDGTYGWISSGIVYIDTGV